MANIIQVKRGANASLPTLSAAEFGFSTDTKQIYIGDGVNNHEIAKMSWVSNNYNNYSHPNHTGDVTSSGDGAQTIADNAVTLAKMAGGTDGNLITYDAAGDPAYVSTGIADQILTSNGPGAAPTFQNATGGSGVDFIIAAVLGTL